MRELMRIADLLGVSADTLIESPPAEDLEVSQRLARLEELDEESRDLLRAIAAKLGVPVPGEAPVDEAPAI